MEIKRMSLGFKKKEASDIGPKIDDEGRIDHKFAAFFGIYSDDQLANKKIKKLPDHIKITFKNEKSVMFSVLPTTVGQQYGQQYGGVLTSWDPSMAQTLLEFSNSDMGQSIMNIRVQGENPDEMIWVAKRFDGEMAESDSGYLPKRKV